MKISTKEEIYTENKKTERNNLKEFSFDKKDDDF